jgi:hypothetical protein
MMLVCFFDMQQRPSRNCILQLSKRAEDLKVKNITVVAVQASKVEQAKLDEWITQNNISFPIGMIQIDSSTEFVKVEETLHLTWGAQSLPWLILTNKEHVVIAEGFAVNELDEKITSLKEK